MVSFCMLAPVVVRERESVCKLMETLMDDTGLLVQKSSRKALIAQPEIAGLMM